MRVDVDLSRADFEAFMKAIQRAGPRGFLDGRIVRVAAVVAIVLAYRAVGLGLDFPSFVLGAGLIALMVVMLLLQAQRRIMPVEDGSGTVLGAHTYRFEEDDIRVASAHADGFVRWTAVREVHSTDSHLFVMIDRNAGIIVPKRHLSSPEEADELEMLVGRLRGWLPPAAAGDSDGGGRS